MQSPFLSRSSWAILLLLASALALFVYLFHATAPSVRPLRTGASSGSSPLPESGHEAAIGTVSPPAPFSDELIASMAKGIEKLSPEDRSNLQASIEYMKSMKELQPILLQEHPEMSAADYRRWTAEVSRLEEKGYLSFSEAAQIEKHLATSQYGGNALEAEQARIDAAYAKKYKDALERNDPTKDPRNQEYQSAQNALIQSVLGMDSYPDGMSRDDYLAEESEKLRLRIYGNGK